MRNKYITDKDSQELDKFNKHKDILLSIELSKYGIADTVNQKAYMRIMERVKYIESLLQNLAITAFQGDNDIFVEVKNALIEGIEGYIENFVNILEDKNRKKNQDD